MSNLICKVKGHDWRYNFVSVPNKCICYRCNTKRLLNLKTLEWEKIYYFIPFLGSDIEIKNRWYKTIR